jgi:hypothetical protein
MGDIRLQAEESFGSQKRGARFGVEGLRGRGGVGAVVVVVVVGRS